MISGLLWMATANAAVLLAARATLRRLSTGRASTDLVLFLLLRFAFIMAAVLAAGLANALTPAGVGLPCAAVLAVLLLRGERFAAHWRAPIPPDYSRVLVAAGAFLAVRSLLQVWFYAPIDGDATSYHLPKVASWIQAGSFRIDMGTDPRAWFPAGFELVETWWALFLHHDALIEVAGLEFLLLAAAATWSLARWLGLTAPSALLAALVVASTPGLSVQSVHCLNDGPSASLVLAAAALIAARVPFGWLLLTGGMAAGVKPTAAYALPGLLLLLFLVRKEPPAPAPGRWGPRLLGVLGLALGAYWYLRTWIVHGSPIYPVGSADILDPLGNSPLQQAGFSVHSLLRNLTQIADHRLYDNRAVYSPLLKHSAGWGAAVVACGLPALLAALRWNPRLRVLAVAFALSLVSVLSLVIPDPFSLRFVLWFPALPALALAAAVERAPRLRFPAAAAVLVSCVATIFSGVYTYSSLVYHLRHGPLEAGGTWLLKAQPEQYRVGLFGRYSLRAYLLQGPDFRRPIRWLRADSPEALEARMLEDGIDLLYSMDTAPHSREGRILAECVRRGWLRRVALSVYALPKGGV